MTKKSYISPKVACVKLYDMMQVTVISGVADEDSYAPRFPEIAGSNNVQWDEENTLNEKFWSE